METFFSYKATTFLTFFQAGTSGNFFMGNGGLAGDYNSSTGAPFCATTSTVEDMDTRGTSLKHCDHCGAKFTFFYKKVRHVQNEIFH